MRKLLKCVLLGLSIALPIGFTFSSDEDVLGEEAEASVVAEDIYRFSLRLKVPQVFANTLSQGYRKYQKQRISGYLHIQWRDDDTVSIAFSGLENQKFKVGNVKVSYTGYEANDVTPTRYNYIGHNRTQKFTTPCLAFFLELEPSYAIGGNNEDNSFYVLCAGYGSSKQKQGIGCRVATRLRGYAAGTQGCGCSAYAHKSPTREASMCGPSSSRVTDVVATWGNWTAKWMRRVGCGGVSVLR